MFVWFWRAWHAELGPDSAPSGKLLSGIAKTLSKIILLEGSARPKGTFSNLLRFASGSHFGQDSQRWLFLFCFPCLQHSIFSSRKHFPGQGSRWSWKAPYDFHRSTVLDRGVVFEPSQASFWASRADRINFQRLGWSFPKKSWFCAVLVKTAKIAFGRCRLFTSFLFLLGCPARQRPKRGEARLLLFRLFLFWLFRGGDFYRCAAFWPHGGLKPGSEVGPTRTRTRDHGRGLRGDLAAFHPAGLGPKVPKTLSEIKLLIVCLVWLW